MPEPNFSLPSLLKKCLEGYTQNQNESANNIIWRHCPKGKNHGLITVKAAVSLAVAVFNDGAQSYIKVLKELGVETGQFANQSMITIDQEPGRNTKYQALQDLASSKNQFEEGLEGEK